MTHIEKRKKRKEKGQKLSQFLNLVKSFKVRQSFFDTSFLKHVADTSLHQLCNTYP